MQPKINQLYKYLLSQLISTLFCIIPKIEAISQKELLRGFLILIHLPIHSNSITMLSRFAVAARSGVTAVKYPFFER